MDQILTTPDGRHSTRDEDGIINVWDAATGKHLRRIVAAWQRAIALSPDGRYLTWPIEDESLKYSPPAHPTWIYTGCRMRLYDLTADKFVARFPAFKGDAWTSAFTPDGETLLTVDYRDAVVRLWDVAAGKEQRTFRIARTEETREHFIRHVVLSPDGKTLAAAYDRADNTSLLFGAVVVRLWDVATGKELHELTGHVNSVEGLAFSPDSRLMATARNGLGNGVFVWDVATGKHVTALPAGLEIGAGSVAFSPDGRNMATASADGTIRVWELATWKVRPSSRATATT